MAARGMGAIMPTSGATGPAPVTAVGEKANTLIGKVPPDLQGPVPVNGRSLPFKMRTALKVDAAPGLLVFRGQACMTKSLPPCANRVWRL